MLPYRERMRLRMARRRLQDAASSLRMAANGLCCGTDEVIDLTAASFRDIVALEALVEEINLKLGSLEES